jgi:hypothetical protein
MIPTYYTSSEAAEYNAIGADLTAGRAALDKAYLALEVRVMARRAAELNSLPVPAGMTLECERGRFGLGMPHTGEIFFMAEREISACVEAGSFASVEGRARSELS